MRSFLQAADDFRSHLQQQRPRVRQRLETRHNAPMKHGSEHAARATPGRYGEQGQGQHRHDPGLAGPYNGAGHGQSVPLQQPLGARNPGYGDVGQQPMTSQAMMQPAQGNMMSHEPQHVMQPQHMMQPTQNPMTSQPQFNAAPHQQIPAASAQMVPNQFGSPGKQHPMFGNDGQQQPIFGNQGQQVPMFGNQGQPQQVLGNQGQPQQVLSDQGLPQNPFGYQGQPQNGFNNQGQPQHMFGNQGQPQQVLGNQGQPQHMFGNQTAYPGMQSQERDDAEAGVIHGMMGPDGQLYLPEGHGQPFCFIHLSVYNQLFLEYFLTDLL